MKTLLIALLAAGPAWAQQAGGGQAFSLQQAVQYGLQNSTLVKNAATDAAIARARVGEIRSAGLPQITGKVDYNRNIAVQRFVLEYGTPATAAFTGGQELPADATNKPFGLGLALNNAASAGLSASQLLFSGTYLIGLKAASVYTDLSAKQLAKARIDQKAAITKAYYQVMVGQEQIKLLDYNVARLDTTLQQIQAQFKAGFIEAIDVSRLEVQRNNLLADRENATRQIDLGVAALKFTMSYPMGQPLTITDKLADAEIVQPTPDAGGNYEQRIDYSILRTQEMLAQLDIKSKRSGYLPNLVAFGTLGANSASTNFGSLFDIPGKWETSAKKDDGSPVLSGQRWYPSSIVGVTLNIPIFDGFEKRYQIEQSKLTLQKVRDSKELVKNQIDFEVQRANISTTNAVSRMQTQKRNLDLAREVVRVTRIKYRQGVGSSLEVTNAETDLRVAQTNYYAAVYDALVAKVDTDVATGRLTAE